MKNNFTYLVLIGYACGLECLYNVTIFALLQSIRK